MGRWEGGVGWLANSTSIANFSSLNLIFSLTYLPPGYFDNSSTFQTVCVGGRGGEGG